MEILYVSDRLFLLAVVEPGNRPGYPFSLHFFSGSRTTPGFSRAHGYQMESTFFSLDLLTGPRSDVCKFYVIFPLCGSGAGDPTLTRWAKTAPEMCENHTGGWRSLHPWWTRAAEPPVWSVPCFLCVVTRHRKSDLVLMPFGSLGVEVQLVLCLNLPK